MMIAQIDEQQIAVIALAVNPAGQANLAADMFGAQFGTIVGTVRMHSMAIRWLNLRDALPRG